MKMIARRKQGRDAGSCDNVEPFENIRDEVVETRDV